MPSWPSSRYSLASNRFPSRSTQRRPHGAAKDLHSPFQFGRDLLVFPRSEHFPCLTFGRDGNPSPERYDALSK
jgi:hypothetical protein